MGEQAKSYFELLQSALALLFSWCFLAAISIIISGKLISKRLPIGISDNAIFGINLKIFQIDARGEEVTTGFIAFLLSFAFCVAVGGADAYQFFRERSGVDIGQWNSLCAIASLLSLLLATSICILAPFLKGAPVISAGDRRETLDRLKDTDND
jgi:hypothetical protein